MKFDIKRVTDDRYLDLKIDRTEKEISLSQELFIDDLLREFGMENYHPTKTSLDPGFDPKIDPDADSGYDNEFIKQIYQSGVGSIQFLASQTRPDIANAAGLLARYNTKPNRPCWLAFKVQWIPRTPCVRGRKLGR